MNDCQWCIYDGLKTPIVSTVKNPVILNLKEKLGFLVCISNKYVSPQNLKKQGKNFKEINEVIWKTKNREETDSSNDQSYSMQKLFRTKTKGEPKKLDEALLKSMQNVKSEMQTFL